MIRMLTAAMVALVLAQPVAGQIRSAINQESVHSDAVLRQLIRASQFVASRRQLISRGSVLNRNEKSGILRSFTFTSSNSIQLKRLSEFAGDRMRALGEQSEFDQREIDRTQSYYQGNLPSETENRVARIAERNSTMPASQIQRLIRASESRDLAKQMIDRAKSVGTFADLLRRRSISSLSQTDRLNELSTDR